MLVAITGGIGAGKSTALNIFKDLGAHTHDTDTIVHNIYQEDCEVRENIVNRWGKEILLDNIPDRKKIAQIVFNNQLELVWLNQLIHPKVKQKINELDKSKLYIIAVPLLYELDWDKDFEKVISVWCTEINQLNRLMARGWSYEECQSRLKAQFSQNKKLELADFGIINDWSEIFLIKQCKKIFKQLNNKEA